MIFDKSAMDNSIKDNLFNKYAETNVCPYTKNEP